MCFSAELYTRVREISSLSLGLRQPSFKPVRPLVRRHLGRVAAVEAGAPKGIIGWIDVPSLDLTKKVMQESDIILATGGPAMVKSAYSSGTPAIGVGAGNASAIIDKSADILNAA